MNRKTALSMRHILTRLPVYTDLEFKAFELQLRELTKGYSIPRTMAYLDFRVSVLKYQQTGHPTCFKAVLPNYYCIEFENGVATLYRNVGDVLDTEDAEISEQPSGKRARCCGTSSD